VRDAIVAIAATLIAQAQGTLAYLTLAVLAGEAATSYGLDPSLIGIYAAIVFFSAAIGCLGTADLIPRFGAIRVTQGCLISSGLGLALLLVPHWSALALSAVLVGIGYGPLTVASSHVLARATPPHLMGLIFSIKQTGVPIGGAVAGLVLPPIAHDHGWHAAVATVVGSSLALVLLLALVRPRLDAERTGGGGGFIPSMAVLTEPLRVVWATPGLRRMTMVSLVFAGTQVGVSSFLVVYMQDAAGLDLQRAGLVLSAANLIAIGGRIFWGAVADWIGHGHVLIAGLGIGMAASIGVALFVSPGWPYIALLLLGLLLGSTVLSWNGVFLSQTAREAPPGKTNAAMSGVLTIMYAGMVTFPSALAALFPLVGSYAAGFILLMVAVAGISSLCFRPPSPRSTPIAR
jgi:MFS family permease